MSTLLAEQILTQLNTNLQALVPATVAVVYRNYPYTFNDASLPAIQIIMGNDTPQTDRPEFLTIQDWTLEVFLDVIVKSSSIPLETSLNAIRAAIHSTIMSSAPTLGLAFVTQVYPGAVTQPEQKSEGEEPVSVMKMLFKVDYRAALNDVTQAG